ncbi:primosomal protein N' - superfamily II helicase [Streptococcus constellatus subsp. constellatus SK53]|nr:primosomal protein N' - superfamily II helicase [Streptococcus constellatus subsp. constellatus SK53]
MKEIVEVLDFTPVLNEEQLWLAEELRKSVFFLQNFNFKSYVAEVSKLQL